MLKQIISEDAINLKAKQSPVTNSSKSISKNDQHNLENDNNINIKKETELNLNPEQKEKSEDLISLKRMEESPSKSISKTVSPNKIKKLSPIKKEKTKINPSKYAKKKIPFALLFCRFVLPYYDYIDNCLRLMSLWNHSMSALWKKEEEKFMEQRLFRRRVLQLTDDYLEDHKIDVWSLNYSYYILDVIQINFSNNFEKFISSLTSTISQNKSSHYRKRFVDIFRLWWFQLPVKQENIILKYLSEKYSEQKICEIYDNKDKLDFIYKETLWLYFRKPSYPPGEILSISSTNKDITKNNINDIIEISNLKLDYRFKSDIQDIEDYLKKARASIRWLSLKGFQKDKWESLLEWNNLNVNILKIRPKLNNLDWFNKLSPNMQKSIRHLSIGYNFKDKPLNTKQGMKSGDGLWNTIEKLPHLISLTLWGYPITTAFEALSKAKCKLQLLKVFSQGNRNFIFDESVGELHCQPGVYEYRNGTLLYRITMKESFKLFEEACSPIQKERWKSLDKYLEVRSFSVVHIAGDISVTSYVDIPSNSLTKMPSTTPWIVIMKPLIQKAFIDHKRVLSSQFEFLKEVTNSTNRLSWNIYWEAMFDFMKKYMHKFNWHDLSVSVELDKQEDRLYLLTTLKRQKHLAYLKLVVRNPQYLNEIMSKLSKINVSNSFEIIIIDVILERSKSRKDASLVTQKLNGKADNLKEKTTERKVDNISAVSSNNLIPSNLDQTESLKQDEKIKDNENKKQSPTNTSKPSSLSTKKGVSKIQESKSNYSKEVNFSKEQPQEMNNNPTIQTSSIQELQELSKSGKIINWWSEWKVRNPKLFKYLSWRTKIKVEQDPNLPILWRKFKVRTYREDDC